MKIELLWRYTWHMFDTMVPGYAFTINSMDYGQSILLWFDVLRWMLAPESGTAGNNCTILQHFSSEENRPP